MLKNYKYQTCMTWTDLERILRCCSSKDKIPKILILSSLVFLRFQVYFCKIQYSDNLSIRCKLSDLNLNSQDPLSNFLSEILKPSFWFFYSEIFKHLFVFYFWSWSILSNFKIILLILHIAESQQYDILGCLWKIAFIFSVRIFCTTKHKKIIQLNIGV